MMSALMLNPCMSCEYATSYKPYTSDLHACAIHFENMTINFERAKQNKIISPTSGNGNFLNDMVVLIVCWKTKL